MLVHIDRYSNMNSIAKDSIAMIFMYSERDRDNLQFKSLLSWIQVQALLLITQFWKVFDGRRACGALVVAAGEQ